MEYEDYPDGAHAASEFLAPGDSPESLTGMLLVALGVTVVAMVSSVILIAASLPL